MDESGVQKYFPSLQLTHRFDSHLPEFVIVVNATVVTDVRLPHFVVHDAILSLFRMTLLGWQIRRGLNRKHLAAARDQNTRKKTRNMRGIMREERKRDVMTFEHGSE